VAKARKFLSAVDSETLATIRSKQAARMVLAKEVEMIKSLVEEGLLTPKHAEEFLEDVSEDTHKIESQRNKLYR
jgi:polyhydroxyalkanoate synthesis regulator phasin